MSDAGADPPPMTPGPQMSLEAIRCSFCGKRGDEVRSIVAGPSPNVAICSECIDLCAQIIAEQRAGGDHPG
jgi:ATP-dependent Clp protease ATP-binding subunit ClpX